MANTNTKHSKNLRIKTSQAWRKKNIKTIAFDLNLNKEEDIEIVSYFDKAESKINALRSLFRKNIKD
jgi:energy-converting hydrogenase A subunit M